MHNTRLILLAKPDTLPPEIAQLFTSSFKEVIILQSMAEVAKHVRTSDCLTRFLRFDLKSEGTRELLSLLARINKDASH